MVVEETAAHMQPGCENAQPSDSLLARAHEVRISAQLPMGPESLIGRQSAASMNRPHVRVDGLHSDPPDRDHAGKPPAGVDAPGVHEEEK